MAGTTLSKQYFINPRIMVERFIWVLAAIIFVPVFLALSGEEVDGILIAAFAFLILMAGSVFLVMRRLVRLIVTEDGVQFRTPGMNIATTWDNIDSLGTRILYGDGEVEGLVLRQSGLDLNGIVRATKWVNYASARTIETYENFLPVSSILGKGWRNTSFGEELRRHVPRLFENEMA